ncbi:hypothetical protein BRADI_2g09874v3 [Brachypodium distachyon]|uniref:Uncharacterized protein n=1 Tax=Brachypodium distachyon TaxID=15368 RepID=A0A2K2D7Q9_BRADI|nr:hypothetical protein BRADI_2g09874v3 [Brachypodium distachyon]
MLNPPSRGILLSAQVHTYMQMPPGSFLRTILGSPLSKQGLLFSSIISPPPQICRCKFRDINHSAPCRFLSKQVFSLQQISRYYPCSYYQVSAGSFVSNQVFSLQTTSHWRKA